MTDPDDDDPQLWSSGQVTYLPDMTYEIIAVMGRATPYAPAR
jgi:hypothetical protein